MMHAEEPLWRPSDDRVRSSQMHAFLQRTVEKHGIDADWPSLHRWSVEHPRAFWADFAAFAGVDFSAPPSATTTGDGMLGTRWFPDARLNFARHLLAFGGDAPAIIAENEFERSRIISRDDLRDDVARCAAALRANGVQQGDRVVGFLPNIPEAVIGMLAAASIGAVWSSCSPDFGIGGVFDRFGQIAPKVLIAADGYTYNGKSIDCLDRVAAIRERIDSIEHIVIVPFLNEKPDLSALGAGTSDWPTFLGDGAVPEPTFAELPFDHPLFIMYSSGTTGVPKCIVHGAGGTLLQLLKEHRLHCDVREGDRLFYFTTCGWMMWNWLVAGLASGASIVLYEGSPMHDGPLQMWRMSDRVGINIFGTSAKYLAACEKADIHPGGDCDLSALRCICSTGSPLSAEQFEWVYREVKSDLQLSSICGGTDIISCFMLGNPLLPVHAGEIQSPGLGMDVQAFDDNGRPVFGEKGELVCCTPFPSQPVGFWHDDDGEKYRKAYFDVYPDIWRHGDFIEITPHGGIIVYGRSDATLNPGGVRIGTAEIYRQVEAFPEIVDSVVIGKEVADDVEIALFVVLRDGLTLDDDLKKRIRTAIAEGATKRHVPRHIRQVSAVPYTLSGKKVELAVSQMVHGRPVKNRDALTNPNALNQYDGILN